jgi:anthraniloyl-CoA monooxygenase
MPTPDSAIQNPKSAIVLGGGPAGLYFALLLKKADPSWEVEVWERNPAGVTYGWGVVFSDRTLASFARADAPTYEAISEGFVIWDAIDVRYRGETVRCGGHVIAAISRKRLLDILQQRCVELGVKLHFERDVTEMEQLPECGLLVAADGVNSLVRRAYEEHFQPRIEMGRAKYIWLGAEVPLDAFTFIFHETEHGLFQVHAYPYSGSMSTFIVECAEDVWLRAGLDKADETQSLAFCQSLLNDDLGGRPLLSNNSKWINFPTLKTRKWHVLTQNSKLKAQNYTVLMGDAVHTAHFSIGSGTKLAMEDAIALAEALATHADVGEAVGAYEVERKPVVDTFQRAARESQTYFETLSRYLVLPPMQFAFQLLTRSGRITYDDLRGKDTRFADAVDVRFARAVGEVASNEPSAGYRVASTKVGESGWSLPAPPPVFTPFCIGEMKLPNRITLTFPAASTTGDGMLDYSHLGRYKGTKRSELERVPALWLTEVCAVSAQGRITPECAGLYNEGHLAAWKHVVEGVHARDGRIGLRLGHAGRRGAARPRREGLDRPLREGGWPLVSASPTAYTPRSRVPGEMSREERERVRGEFALAARMALDAGFDLLQLHMAHGYLLASFLSPLSNRRDDEYGGDREARARYPLEVFEAVRAVWPGEKPLSVALHASDYREDGWQVEDAVWLARELGARGCGLVEVLAGQTVPETEAPYARGFLTQLSDRVRNEAGMPTLVGGYLVTTNDANTVLAGGRADLCLMTHDG